MIINRTVSRREQSHQKLADRGLSTAGIPDNSECLPVAIVKDTSFTASTRVFLMIPPVNVLQIWLTLSIQDTPHFPSIRKLRLRDRLSQEELAQRLGKSRSAVANSLRLLQLPRPMQDALKDGVFTPGHARAVLALPERALQDILFNAVMTRRLSVRDAEEAVIHWKRHGLLPSSLMGASAPVARSARAPKPACIKLAIRQLRENVAPKASISGTDRAGRITLPYESEEQLAELLSRLGLSVELSEAKPE